MKGPFKRVFWLSLALPGMFLTASAVSVSVAISFDVYALENYVNSSTSSPGSTEWNKSKREARLGVEAALLFNPWHASYWHHRHLFQGQHACVNSGAQCEASIESLKNTIYQRPFWFSAWSALAVALAEKGDSSEQAGRAMDRAMRFGPHEFPVNSMVLVVGLAYPELFIDTRCEQLDDALKTMLDDDAGSLVSIAEKIDRTDRLLDLATGIGRRGQVESILAARENIALPQN